jgi:DNA-directed RNA polymerase specialized sigma subunit
MIKDDISLKIKSILGDNSEDIVTTDKLVDEKIKENINQDLNTETKLDKPAKLDEDQFLRVFNVWKSTKNPKLLNDLIKLTEPVWKKAISIFGGDPNDPLHIAYAKEIVIDGLNKFDPEKAKINTFLWFKLNNLQRKVLKVQNVLNIPERDLQLKNKLELIEEELREKLGRDPSDQELADYAGITVKRIARLRRGTSPVLASSLQMENEAGEESHEIPVSIPTEDKKRRELILDLVHFESTPEQQVLMEYVFGMNGKKQLSVKDAAKKAGLSLSTAYKFMQDINNRISKYYNELNVA